MLKFFYGSKNVIGLIFILVPAFAFLFYANSETSFATLLLSAAIGIPFARSCYNCLPFKFWLCFASFAASYSTFMLVCWRGTPLEYIGSALLGLSAGGLIFILMPNIIVGWFRLNKTIILGAVLGVCVTLSFPIEAALHYHPLITILLITALMIFSSLFLLEKPIMLNFSDSIEKNYHAKKNRIKSCVFFLFTALSIAVVCRIGYMDVLYSIGSPSASLNFGMKSLFVNAGMAAGPILISVFTDKKGVYSGCIMLLFLSELSVMCAGFYNNDGIMAAIGHFTFGCLLTSNIVICSLLTYYLLGPASYNRNLSSIISFIPIGMIALLPMRNMEDINFTSYPVVIGTLFMLVIGFFTVFSAWKHRLVLLKTPKACYNNSE